MIGTYADLLALDIFWANPDRRIDKANFLSNGKKLLIFDHELAFSFNETLPFLRNSKPWEIPDIDMGWISNNFCFDLLKGRNINFSNFTNRLEVLNDSFWEKASQIIPREWNNGLLANVRSHLDLIISNKEHFATELNRILL